MLKRLFLIFIFSLISRLTFSQLIEKVYKPYIHTAQLFKSGDQQGFPVWTLNSADRLQLEFDDLEGDVKSYYYSFVLCDYNWKPANLSPFEYTRGFTQNRITTYRNSSIALTRYTHYQAFLPDGNGLLTRSGNYLLKVYTDSDTSKLAFTKQLVVLEPKGTVSGQVVQPWSASLFTTHQKIRLSVNLAGINAFSAAQQVKVVILQNNRWDNAQRDIPPTYVRGNMLEFNTEDYGIFPGGKEFRWLDLRSFRLQSDRVDHAIYKNNSTEIFVKPDLDRTGQRYLYYPDYDGMFNIITYETINPFWQGDYATVYFTLVPPNGSPYPNRNIYLGGSFTDWGQSDTWKMNFNPELGVYQGKALLKQGYYSYEYLSVSKDNPSNRTDLEGNYWETQNRYTVLVYYKGFTDRNDQLIGYTSLNSRNDRPGFSF